MGKVEFPACRTGLSHLGQKFQLFRLAADNEPRVVNVSQFRTAFGVNQRYCRDIRRKQIARPKFESFHDGPTGRHNPQFCDLTFNCSQCRIGSVAFRLSLLNVFDAVSVVVKRQLLFGFLQNRFSANEIFLTGSLFQQCQSLSACIHCRLCDSKFGLRFIQISFVGGLFSK